jgi:hypothetical protein
MHRRDDGIDSVFFKNLDERIDGGVIGNNEGSSNFLLLLFVDL